MAEKTTDIAVREMVYEMANGEEMKLTMNMVRRFLVQGRAEFVTESELMYFMHECKARKLNPFLRQAWLIKYSQNDNAQILESIHHKRAKARRAADCKGWRKGIIVKTKDGEIHDSMGIVLEGDTLLGGFFEATPEGWDGPWRLEVNLAGYIKKTAKGAVTKFWSEDNQPSMIAKVAESQGLSALWGDAVGTAVIPGEVSPGEDVIDMELGEDGFTPPAPPKRFKDLAAEKTPLPNKALEAFIKRSAKRLKITDDELEAMAEKDFEAFWKSFKKSLEKPKEKLVSDWDQGDWKTWVDTWKAKGSAFVGLSMTEKFVEILKVAPEWVREEHFNKWSRDSMAKHVGKHRWPLAPPEDKVDKLIEDAVEGEDIPRPPDTDAPPIGDPPPEPPAKKTVKDLQAERDMVANTIANTWNDVDIRQTMDYLEIPYRIDGVVLNTLLNKSLHQVKEVQKCLADNESLEPF